MTIYFRKKIIRNEFLKIGQIFQLNKKKSWLNKELKINIHKYVYECVVTTLHVNGFRSHLSLVYQDKGLFLVVCLWP